MVEWCSCEQNTHRKPIENPGFFLTFVGRVDAHEADLVRVGRRLGVRAEVELDHVLVHPAVVGKPHYLASILAVALGK